MNLVSAHLIQSVANMVGENVTLCGRDGMLCLEIRRCAIASDSDSDSDSDSVSYCGSNFLIDRKPSLFQVKPQTRFIPEKRDHRQCRLQNQDGRVILLQPTIRTVPDKVRPGWLPTDLDHVCQDLYPREPRRHNISGPWKRRKSGPERREYLRQQKLCFERGKLSYTARAIPTRNLGPIQTLPFLGLPYEIREQIYKELFSTVKSYGTLDLNFDRDSLCWRHVPMSIYGCVTDTVVWPEILATCSQIYYEARLLIFHGITFHPVCYELKEWADKPMCSGRVVSEDEIHSIVSLELDWYSISTENNDFPIFQDFVSLRQLHIDYYYGEEGIQTEDIGRDRGAKSAFTMVIASAQRHASQLTSFTCRLGIEVNDACVQKSAAYYPGDIDTIETHYAVTFEIHRDNKRMVEVVLENEGLLQGFELEWTFHLVHGSPIAMHGSMQFGWGDSDWPRDKTGRKMIKSELTESFDGEDMITEFIEDR